jgi:hypothetical protein
MINSKGALYLATKVTNYDVFCVSHSVTLTWRVQSDRLSASSCIAVGSSNCKKNGKQDEKPVLLDYTDSSMSG